VFLRRSAARDIFYSPRIYFNPSDVDGRRCQAIRAILPVGGFPHQPDAGAASGRSEDEIVRVSGGYDGVGNDGAGNDGAGNDGAGNDGAGNDGGGNDGGGNDGAGRD
jgi:hypothetical protein